MQDIFSALEFVIRVFIKVGKILSGTGGKKMKDSGYSRFLDASNLPPGGVIGVAAAVNSHLLSNIFLVSFSLLEGGRAFGFRLVQGW